ncbi:MAG TPA: anthrone oxygenase family protein [Iamia sp.]
MSTVIVLTVVAAVMGGLVAGVFLAFSTFVVQGIDRAPAPAAITAMQGINVTAPHPLFMLPLFGGPLVGLAAAVLALTGDGDVADGWVVAGAVAGFVPAVMTAAFHIPRNNALDRLDPAAPDAAATWTRYVREWVGGNHVRTLGALAGSVAMTVALVA